MKYRESQAPMGSSPSQMPRKRFRGDRGKNKPLVRKAGARQRLVLGERQVTFTWMVWYPVAPLGSVRCFTAVWV